MTSNQYFYGLIPVDLTISENEKMAILEQYPAVSIQNNQEGFSIENESSGTTIYDITLLLNEFTIEQTQGSNPRPYLKMKFSNHLGTYSAKMWDNDGAIEKVVPLLEEHSVFTITGRVEEYRGFKSITLNTINPSSNEIDPFSLIACTQQSIEDFTVELFTYVSELAEPYRAICFAAMNRFWNEYSMRPAAMGHHHAYLGGLLKHTVGLMRIARYILKREENHYKAIIKLINQVEKVYKKELWDDLLSDKPGNNPRNIVWKDSIDHLYTMFYGMAKHKEEEPNYSMLMCAIFYHDIGKLLEYQHAGKGTEEFKFLYPTADHRVLDSRKPTGITMDELGSLIGHIPYGVMMIGKIIESEGITISLNEIHRLQHAILCHHGKLEWGANISPKTVEGYLIHIVDYLDSRYERTEEVK